MTCDPTHRPVPFSMETPFNSALYLRNLIKAASFIVEETQSHPNLGETGLLDLLTVIQERAEALVQDLGPLDHPELWAVAQAAVNARRECGFDYSS